MSPAGRIAAVLFCTAAALFAQNAGRVTGTIVDASGNVVVGAQVQLISEATNEVQTVASSATGDFTFPSVPPSTYRVR
ncbi:MAG TPA: carboxypeptidase-like regulatory domain-containing protein, partial [Bryobacteraceae bacterium]|nr:carboxypeptidase-like regulatory domain-containing protein [Bryobacteraceae bacterium]